MSILQPQIYLNSICDVTPHFLRDKGIKALILDVDNTLTEHNSQEISDHVFDWIQLMRKNGIKLMIASNNHGNRIRPFANRVGIDAMPNSMKPLPIGYRKAQKLWKLPAKEIAVIGDQIYTDITGANLCGMMSIMVKMISPEHNWFFRLKRVLERPVLKKYARQHGSERIV